MLGEYTNKKMAAASSCQLQNNTMIQTRCYPSSLLCICLCTILTLTLFPYPAKKGFFDGGNSALISRRQLILNSSGFRSITSLKFYAYKLNDIFIFPNRMLTVTQSEIWAFCTGNASQSRHLLVES